MPNKTKACQKKQYIPLQADAFADSHVILSQIHDKLHYVVQNLGLVKIYMCLRITASWDTVALVKQQIGIG